MKSVWCMWFTMLASSTHVSGGRVTRVNVTENDVQADKVHVVDINISLKNGIDFLKERLVSKPFSKATHRDLKEGHLSLYLSNGTSAPGGVWKSETEMRNRHGSDFDNLEKRNNFPEATHVTSILEDCKRGRQFNLWFRLMCQRLLNERQ